MNTYPRVYLTYHADGNVGIGTPPDASAPVMGEPVEHLRVMISNQEPEAHVFTRSTIEGGRNWTPIFTLQDVQDATLAEREACAKVLFDYAERDDLSDSDESLLKHLFELIRARGEQ